MKIVQIDQGSNEWHIYREKGIGASEAATLLNKNPYKKIEKLYMEKIMGAENIDNPAMARGRELEPIVRAEMEKRLGYELPPLCAIHDDYDFVRASFDGINLDKKTLIEIKCPGEKTHAIALAGKVPPHYMYQCQWQLVITGYDSMTYVSYSGSDYALVDVVADKQMQDELINAAKVFWNHVENKTMPMVEEVAGVEELISSATDLQEKIKVMESELDIIKEKLKTTLGNKPKLRCGQFEFGWIHQKGSVDYSKVTELKGIDLDKYRKAEIKKFYMKAIT